MKKKKGFIATSLIYSFLLVFMAILLASLANMLASTTVINRYNYHVLSNINRHIVSDTLIRKIRDKANEFDAQYNDETKYELFSFTGYNEEAEYRFIGDDPHNYVKFNCETNDSMEVCEVWRIIGIFPIMKKNNGGSYEKRESVKMIYVGTYTDSPQYYEYIYDTNNTNGITEINFVDSFKFNNEFNIYDANGVRIDGDGSTSSNLNDYPFKGTSAKYKLLSPYKLGIVSDLDNISGKVLEEYENTSTINSKDLYVGLMYASDYVYSYAKLNEKECFNNNSDNDDEDCKSWLYSTDTGHPELTADLLINEKIIVINGGKLESKNPDEFTNGYIRPVIYLPEDASVMNDNEANGTKEHPYVLK